MFRISCLRGKIVRLCPHSLHATLSESPQQFRPIVQVPRSKNKKVERKSYSRPHKDLPLSQSLQFRRFSIKSCIFPLLGGVSFCAASSPLAVIPTAGCHSRTCFRRCKLVPAKAGSGNPEFRISSLVLRVYGQSPANWLCFWGPPTG